MTSGLILEAIQGPKYFAYFTPRQLLNNCNLEESPHSPINNQCLLVVQDYFIIIYQVD